MDRGSLAPMLEMTTGDCGDCETVVQPDAAQNANRCVAHCTSDLQLSGSHALAVHPADVPLLVLPRAEVYRLPRTMAEVSPPGAIPVRILLHSFLI